MSGTSLSAAVVVRRAHSSLPSPRRRKLFISLPWFDPGGIAGKNFVEVEAQRGDMVWSKASSTFSFVYVVVEAGMRTAAVV